MSAPDPYGTRREPGRAVLADGWYSWLIPSVKPFTDILSRAPRWVQWLAWRAGPLRGAWLFLASARFQHVAMIRAERGWRSLLLLRALLGRRRKLLALHFIDHPPRKQGLGRIVDGAWRPIDRWATGRALLAAQVLSRSERELYAGRFAVEASRFQYIPFAWRKAPTASPAHAARELVVAAGRAFCDWPTLFEAARGERWPLVVVCGTRDWSTVQRLNAQGRAQVRCDLPHEEVRELLGRAAVSVLSMHDGGVSHGQIRLCDAVDCRAAVVATRTKSLEEYVESGRTAVLVDPGDADAMRAAITSLHLDPVSRERLAEKALQRAERWTHQHYLDALEAFLHRRTDRLPLEHARLSEQDHAD